MGCVDGEDPAAVEVVSSASRPTDLWAVRRYPGLLKLKLKLKEVFTFGVEQVLLKVISGSLAP